jgi:hypothetical protein
MPVATPGALGAADGAVIRVKGGHGHGGGHGWATTAVGWARGRGHHYGGRHHRHWCFNPMGRGASVGGLLHLGQTRMSPIGTLLPIQHVRCEVGSLSETGPLVLDTRLSHLDPTQTSSLIALGLESRKTTFHGLIECDPRVRVPNRANSATLSYAFTGATFT